MYYLVAIVGLAILMIVHEAGHFLMARRAGMRVTKFSIGFGPTFFKIQPIDESGTEADRAADRDNDRKPPQSYFWFTAFGDRLRFRLMKYDPARHGPTIYQVAMIPFLAYVQIAGMNPLEDVDPNDKGSYANARLLPRVLTIAGGPVMNYLFASIFFFIVHFIHGKDVMRGGTYIEVADEPDAVAAAKNGGMKDGDEIRTVDGVEVTKFEDIPDLIKDKQGQVVHFVVLRKGQEVNLEVTPELHSSRAMIGITPEYVAQPEGVREATVAALTEPVDVVKGVFRSIADKIHGRDDSKLSSAVGMVKEMKKVAERSLFRFVSFLGAISAYLAVFNLLPIPALDGGRLLFLGYEAVTRKRPNPTMEAQIHGVALVMLLGLMIYITVANDLGLGAK